MTSFSYQRIASIGWGRLSVLALAFCFPVFAFVVSDVASAILFFLFVAGTILIVRQPSSRKLSRQHWLLILAFLGYFLVGVFCYLLGARTRLGWEILFRDIRLVFAVPALVALIWVPPPKELVKYALVIGGAIAGTTAAIQMALHGLEWRATGAAISIVFGHVSAALAVTLGVWLAIDRARWPWVGVIGWGFAALASGTRGSWVILILAAVLWVGVAVRQAIRSRSSNGGINWKRLLFVLLLAGGLAASFWSITNVRLEQAFQSLKLYLTGEMIEGAAAWTRDGCPNDARFFNALEKAVLAGGPGRAKVSIQSVETAAGGFCHSSGRALLLRNTARKGSIWFAVPVTGGINQQQRVLFSVKGSGRIVNGRNPVSFQEVENESFSKHWFPIDGTVENHIVGRLAPNQSLWLIPVQTWKGQYDFIYVNSSVGKRLDMWRSALLIFRSHPSAGLGPGGFKLGIARLADQGEISQDLRKFDHAHNDLLTMMVDRGVLGVAAYMFLLGIPAWIGYRGIRAGKRHLGFALLVLVFSTAVSGLTETMFNHSSVITYYAVMISILAAPLGAETTDDRELAE